MNPAIITAPIDEAREKRDRYSAFNRSRRKANPEYQRAELIYARLALGRDLIDVGAAIRDGGFDGGMRPRLAIARADRQQVYFWWRSHRDSATFDSNLGGLGRSYPQMVETVNFNRQHGFRKTSNGHTYAADVQGYALVPMIPPEHLPVAPLAQFHILWEVERWADERIGAKPPVDPFLLQRVVGDVFEIHAKWDLTDVERMVMEGRARVQG